MQKIPQRRDKVRVRMMEQRQATDREAQVQAVPVPVVRGRAAVQAPAEQAAAPVRAAQEAAPAVVRVAARAVAAAAPVEVTAVRAVAAQAPCRTAPLIRYSAMPG
ncbi:hypothetical protein [Enterobacter sp.]|uniref:hypothetical protein n=1 Tax=Enterobacter sp. TaxID=42895 RepID=UPI00296FB2D1|nr:hypothetical protein [Enterobacter sp.]